MKLWFIALLIWFGLYALLALTNVKFAEETIVMGILAAIVCILGFFDRRISGPNP